MKKILLLIFILPLISCYKLVKIDAKSSVLYPGNLYRVKYKNPEYGPEGFSVWTFKPLQLIQPNQDILRTNRGQNVHLIKRENIIWLKLEQ